MSAMWRALLIVPLLVVLGGPASAIEPTFLADGAAIRGYDPVAYFTRGEPTEGDPSIGHEYQGATWYFATDEHRDLFAADPAKYAPQYGGYCAWAASKNYVAPTDPAAWDIVDGKLYLNFSKLTQVRWKVGKRGNIAKGDGQFCQLCEHSLSFFRAAFLRHRITIAKFLYVRARAECLVSSAGNKQHTRIRPGHIVERRIEFIENCKRQGIQCLRPVQRNQRSFITPGNFDNHQATSCGD